MMVRKSLSKIIRFLRRLVSFVFYNRASLKRDFLTSLLASASRRDKKKTRFNDPKERAANVLVTHVGMIEAAKASDNGSTAVAATLLSNESQSRSKKRSRSSSSSSSSRHKKLKKNKKSSKHSKKSSKKRNRSRSRDYDREKRKSYLRSDRHSIESKSSVRSSESKRHRSRSRSRSRDRRHRRY